MGWILPSVWGGLREEMERAVVRKVRLHHIHSLFEATFPEAGGVVRAEETGRFEVISLPPGLRDPDAQSDALTSAVALHALLPRQGERPLGPTSSAGCPR